MQKLDLMTAKVNGAAVSRKNSTTVYLLADKDGDFSLSYNPLDGTQYAFRNGTEVPQKEVDEIVSNYKSKNSKQSQSKTKIMSKEKSAPAKKVAATTKPAAAKKEVKKEKPAKVEGTGKATTLILSDKQWASFEKQLEANGSNIREAVREAIVSKYKL